MRINSSTDKISEKNTDKAGKATQTAGAAAAESKYKKNAKSAVPSEAERVEVSNKAKELAKAKQIATSASDVNEEKVARLKAAIENGSYKVDADKIADRLVEEHLGTSL